MESNKRFSEWEDVDCNECARYWDSSCDGAKINSKAPRRPCTTFLPTRSVIIPEQIKRLQKAVKLIWWAIAGLIGCVLGILGWIIT